MLLAGGRWSGLETCVQAVARRCLLRGDGDDDGSVSVRWLELRIWARECPSACWHLFAGSLHARFLRRRRLKHDRVTRAAESVRIVGLYVCMVTLSYGQFFAHACLPKYARNLVAKGPIDGYSSALIVEHRLVCIRLARFNFSSPADRLWKLHLCNRRSDFD